MIAKLSPHHFATAFKVSTGISPHRYVIERRINRARDLLIRKEKTISEIAVAVGFSSQSPPNGEFPPEDGSDAAEVSPVPGLRQGECLYSQRARGVLTAPGTATTQITTTPNAISIETEVQSSRSALAFFSVDTLVGSNRGVSQ